MGTIRRVEGEQAGPEAVGILVPPGKRTFLILRPRATDLDLVLVRPAGLDFWQMSHDEASAAAQRLYRLLRAWAEGGDGCLLPEARPGGTVVRLVLGPMTLLACPRVPGRPYQPLLCPDETGCASAVAGLSSVLLPPDGAEREVYFNVRFFEA